MLQLDRSISPWVARFDNDQEQHMRDGFLTAAESIMGETDRYAHDQQSPKIGLEVELPLVDRNLNPVAQSLRDEIIASAPSFTSAELAAHQLEIINDTALPITLNGLTAIESDLTAKLESIVPLLTKQGTGIVRIGCFPLIAAGEVRHTQGEPKYAKYTRCPQWHAAHQYGAATRKDTANPYVVGLMNAVHVTIDAAGFSDAIDKLNRSLMISPMAIALGANAQFLNLSDTQFADIRFAAWETSHDTRNRQEYLAGRVTRVGLPRRYYSNVADYFQRIMTYPFILNDELSLQRSFEVGNGLYWRDARLKFFREQGTVGVEFRPIPLQPSLVEDVAMVGFFLGRLTWSQLKNERLLPLQRVRFNKQNAMHFGLASHLWITADNEMVYLPAREVLRQELDRAGEGLAHWGMDDLVVENYLQPLRYRLARGSPAEQLAAAKLSFQAAGANEREALIAAMDKFGLIEFPSEV